MMKLKQFILAFCAAAGVILGCGMVSEQACAQVPQYDYNVADFGANGSDTLADSDEINDALYKAKNAANTVTVYVPAGTYYIDRSLAIYSNTNLILDDDAVIVATKHDFSMLHNAHVHSDGISDHGKTRTCTDGGYSQLNNVTISGGTWDENDLKGTGNNSVFVLRHGQNITLENMTVKHSTNHMFNLSGDKNVVVRNVTFRDAAVYSGTDETFWRGLSGESTQEKRYSKIEAIHLDYMNALGEPSSYPADNTPCKDILVENCTFDNVFAGVGSHHENKDAADRAGNIVIKNNTFKNIMGYAVNAYGMDGVTFTNDTPQTLDEVGGIITIVDSSDVSVSNVSLKNTTKNLKKLESKQSLGAMIRIESGSKNASVKNVKINSKSPNNSIYVKDGSTALISRCTLTNPGVAGVRIDSAKATVQNCTITNAATQGVSMQNATNSVIASNKITNAKNIGIYVYTTKKCTIKNNTVTGSRKMAIGLAGTSKIKTTANVYGNTAKTKSVSKDIFFGDYCTKCVCKNNITSSKGIGIVKGVKVTQSGNKVK